MSAPSPINVTNLINIGTDFTEIYKPNDWYNGYISDLMFSARLPNLAEYKPPKAESEFLNRQERNEQVRDYGAKHPHMHLSLYTARKETPENRTRLVTIRLWNLEPEYRDTLFPYISQAAQILLQSNDVWTARVEDAGHGLPGADDEITIRVAGFELPRGEASRDQPIWYSMTLTQANTEYSLTLPDNTRKYSIKARGASGDPQGNIRYAFKKGTVTAASGYDLIPFSNEESDSNLNLIGETLYLSTETANLPILVKAWV